MCKDRSQAHAFTLIELLVVVAVIALLLGILVPALAATKQAAETTKATVAARSLMQAYLMYAAEHKDEVLPAYLSPQDATTGVYDEFGNPLVPPVSQRWVYRLGPYFDYGWAGTTHIGTRAELLDQYEQIIEGTNGLFNWSYNVSVFPSFGINRRYMGGDARNPQWMAQRYHVRRMSDARQSSNMIVFASARYVAGPSSYEGYVEVDPPPLEGVYNDRLPTTQAATAFGHLRLSYQDRAVIGFLDGHSATLSEKDLLDRRRWANPAAKRSDPNWEPEP
ncbi:MAG: type II secretion system protein [Phycisphaerales bacterium]|nr:type II secretion system protein [Phycisphaerales bacterium]